MKTIENFKNEKIESPLDKVSRYQPDFFDTSICKTINHYLLKQRRTVQKCSAYYFPDYIKGFHFLFSDNFSPITLEKRLNSFGWSPILVDGYLTGHDYFNHLHRREIPINIHVRPNSQVDFALFPDMIHDIFGHCPMLLSKKYSMFLDEISAYISSIELTRRDREYIHLHRSTLESRIDSIPLIEEKERELKNNPTPYYYHTTVALWTLEFGLLQNRGRIYAYGAALTGSPLEMTTLNKGNYSVTPLTNETFGTKFNFSNLQDKLYSTSSFDRAKELIQTFAKQGGELTCSQS